MKKVLVASILGIAASVASSFGQGSIIMDNYTGGNSGAGYASVTFGDAGAATAGGGSIGGVADAGPWHAVAYYVLGNGAGVAWVPNTGSADPGNFGGGLALFSGTTSGNPYPATLGGGYFQNINLAITPYTSGPVSFVLAVYDGATYASSTHRGYSNLFTESGLATGLIQAAYMTGNVNFQVFTVPEPSTIALAGLGLASLLVVRRRK